MARETPLVLDDLQTATVGVYGFGNTGQTLAGILSDRVDRLIVYDDESVDDSLKNSSDYSTVTWVESPTVLQENLDYLLVSPGVPGDHPMLRQAREFNVPVWGDLEFSYRLMDEGTIWAVTGTNGKSTCVELIGRLLEAVHGDDAVAVCGNRGNPFLSALLRDPAPDHFVVEVSSFQVETMDVFSPDAALLTNLGDDHMNYHRNRLEYHALKLELLKRVPVDGAIVLPEAEAGRSWLRNRNYRTVNLEKGVSGPVRWDVNEGLRLGELGIELAAVPSSLRQFPENVLGALSLVDLVESVSVKQITNAFESFSPLPYRAEPIGVTNGKTVINDSKGTNPSAVVEQLRRREGPVHLVLGGEAKQTDYGALVETIDLRNVRSVILAGTGSTTDRVADRLEDHGIGFRRIDDWESAVKEAYRTAGESGTVLLSPGGTSFDAFENYKERGEMFDRWIEEVEDQ